jgi:hypothetical protein
VDIIDVSHIELPAYLMTNNSGPERALISGQGLDDSWPPQLNSVSQKQVV